jgi:type IV fimbrial biogenesis protein FimT
MIFLNIDYANSQHEKSVTANEYGFSLIELMVTISITAVLLAIGLPNLSNLYRSARLSTQADLLVSSLNQARLEAIKQRALVSVCSVADPNTATVCPPTSNLAEINAAKTYWSSGWIVISGATISQRVSAKSGVVIDVATAPTVIEFTGTLGSVVNVGVFKLCGSGQKEQQINVGFSGHISKSINSNSVCL